MTGPPDRDRSQATSPEFSLSVVTSAPVHESGVGLARWHAACAEVRDQLAQGALVERDHDPLKVARRMRQRFDAIERDLLAPSLGAHPSRSVVLRSAAISLQCCATMWQAFAPVAGDRRSHLLARLTVNLASTERRIRCAEAPLATSGATVISAARDARASFDELRLGVGERAEALTRLENAAIALASLAIRIATNLDRIGQCTRSSQHLALPGQLNLLARELSAAARAGRDEQGEQDSLGTSLAAIVSAAPTDEVLELALGSARDPCLRAERWFALRARWLALGVGLWSLVHGLDELLEPGIFDDEERLKSGVMRRAERALVASAVHTRPGEFDHRYAWERHREASRELVRGVCEALQTREPDAVMRCQHLALHRLARALAAIWTIDAHTRAFSAANR